MTHHLLKWVGSKEPLMTDFNHNMSYYDNYQNNLAYHYYEGARESKYSSWLRNKGYKRKSNSTVNPKFPIGLIIYTPAYKEYHFDNVDQAFKHTPGSPNSHWQVFNLVTGEILLEPKLKLASQVRKNGCNIL